MKLTIPPPSFFYFKRKNISKKSFAIRPSLFFLCLVICSVVTAQQNITGTIKNEKEEALEGVTVSVKNSKTSVISDKNGNYEIRVPDSSSILVFNSIGYDVFEEPVHRRNMVDIILTPAVQALDQVVVVGYSVQKKIDLTGAVGSLSSKELMQSQPVSVEQAMKGKIAGVQVQNSSGAPGSGINIKIRGANSITAGTSPLYVVDGFPYPVSNDPLNNPLSTISPDAIESISILKDVSSTAIYGAEGANGVVLITTKKAKEGTSQLSFNTTVGVSTITKRLPMLDNEGYMKAMMLENAMNGRYQNSDFYEDYKNQIWNTDPSRFTDYQDITIKPALRQAYEISYAGGTKNVKNLTTLSYLNDDGIAINTGFKRYYFRSNTTVQATNRLSISANISYDYNIRHGLNFDSTSNIFNQIVTFSPLIPKEWTFQNIDNNLFYTGPIDNPYRQLNDISLDNVRSSFSGQVDINYKISEYLTLKGGIGIRLPRDNVKEFIPTTIYSSYLTSGYANYQTEDQLNLRYYGQLNYSRNFKQMHQVDVGVVAESNSNQYQLFSQTYTHFNTDLGWQGIYGAESGSFVVPPVTAFNEYKILSGLMFGNYAFKDKYLVKASLRADGSSRFGPQNRWGLFPSGAIGWNISNEDFFKSSSVSNVINYAKLRISAGAVGNDQIPNYLWYNTLRLNSRRGVYANPSGLDTGGVYGSTNPVTVPGLTTTRQSNADISWETTKEINYGLDLGLFKSRINISFDYYSRKTTNMLLDESLPMTSGFASVTKNIGSISNRGVELGISASIIRNKNFGWDASFNISQNKSKVLSLGSVNQMLENRYVGSGNSTQNALIKVGMPLGLLYGLQVEGIRSNWNSDDNAPSSNWWYATQREAPYGFISFADINGDGKTDYDDRTVIGDVEPAFIGGFTQTFHYKFLELSMNFSGSYGNDLINANYYSLILQSGGINNKLKIFAQDGWWGNNPTGTIPGPGPVYWMGYQNAASNSEIVEDGSFLKWNYLAFSVNLPSHTIERLKVKALKLTYTLSNVYTWTRYSGYDPEVSSPNSSNYNNRILSGVDFSSYPYSRTHSLSLNVTF